MEEVRKGYVQIYTGNGKGKTTCSIGLAMRALGAGMKVFIHQFLKGREVSEVKFIHSLQSKGYPIQLNQSGTPNFIIGKPAKEDIERARKSYNQIISMFRQSSSKSEDEKSSCKSSASPESSSELGDFVQYNMFILDEILSCISLGIFSEEDIIQLMEEKPKEVELILTGRGATERVIEKADLVTEMKEIKHYYHAGVPARIGIEM